MINLRYVALGREPDWASPSSLSSSATVPVIIGEPWRAWVSDSTSWMLRPTTLRLKMSMIE